MNEPVRLISTDFDGTIFAETDSPAIAPVLQQALRDAQQAGARWVINTGRDLDSLMDAARSAPPARLADYLVLVEREIYVRNGQDFDPLPDWNRRCREDHAALFERVRRDVPRLRRWINERFEAAVFDDEWSPLCIVARDNPAADEILLYLQDYCREVPHLAIMRNDVYARMCHDHYDKGTALSEIARRHGWGPEAAFAAGDHFNDLPMLSTRHATRLAAPSNAIDRVKQAVREQGGWVASQPHGFGVAEALAHYRALAQASGPI